MAGPPVTDMLSDLVSDFAVYSGSVSMSITGLADQYIRSRDVSRAYAANVRRTAAKMDAAGITPANICGDSVNIWLASMRQQGLRPVTLASERRTALTIWRYGIDEGIILAPIRNVVKPKMPGRLTRAFTRSDLTDLVKRFSFLDLGAFQSGCPRSLWLRAWVAFVYETGARFSDAHALHAEALIDGGVAWVASKTQRPVVKKLSPETRALLDELVALSPDGTVFRWAISRRHAFATIRKYFRECGLSSGRTQWLRRSGATHVEMERAGAAREYLGHSASSHGLAEKHYLDMTQLMDRAPSPVSLGQE